MKKISLVALASLMMLSAQISQAASITNNTKFDLSISFDRKFFDAKWVDIKPGETLESIKNIYYAKVYPTSGASSNVMRKENGRSKELADAPLIIEDNENYEVVYKDSSFLLQKKAK